MNHNTRQEKYWNKEAYDIARTKMTVPAIIELENFFNFINLLGKTKILDVGCGGGRLTIPLLKKGYEVTGTEIAEKNITEIAHIARKENLIKNLTLKKTSLEKPEFRNKFDIAICCNIIHHLNPDTKLLIMKNIHSALKRGGKIAIIEPNPFCLLYYPWYLLKEITGTDTGRWEVEKEFLNSTPKKLKNLLHLSGFKNIILERYAVIPSRVGTIIPPIISLNKLLVKTPLIKNFSAFIWIKA